MTRILSSSSVTKPDGSSLSTAKCQWFQPCLLAITFTVFKFNEMRFRRLLSRFCQRPFQLDPLSNQEWPTLKPRKSSFEFISISFCGLICFQLRVHGLAILTYLFIHTCLILVKNVDYCLIHRFMYLVCGVPDFWTYANKEDGDRKIDASLWLFYDLNHEGFIFSSPLIRILIQLDWIGCYKSILVVKFTLSYGCSASWFDCRLVVLKLVSEIPVRL